MTQEGSGRALRAAEIARTRHRGMSSEAREALNARLHDLKDWWGVCRHCGERLEGSLKEVKGHDCGHSG